MQNEAKDIVLNKNDIQFVFRLYLDRSKGKIHMKIDTNIHNEILRQKIESNDC